MLLEPLGHIDECKFISLLTVLLAQQRTVSHTPRFYPPTFWWGARRTLEWTHAVGSIFSTKRRVSFLNLCRHPHACDYVGLPCLASSAAFTNSWNSEIWCCI